MKIIIHFVLTSERERDHSFDDGFVHSTLKIYFIRISNTLNENHIV